jgi:hypothetical protein
MALIRLGKKKHEKTLKYIIIILYLLPRAAKPLQSTSKGTEAGNGHALRSTTSIYGRFLIQYESSDRSFTPLDSKAALKASKSSAWTNLVMSLAISGT